MRTPSALLLIAFSAGCYGSQIGAVDPAVMQKYEARATVVSGQVSRAQDDGSWALSKGEQVPVRQTIWTGPDGFGHFEVSGGSSFDIFANSRVVFRQNSARAGDLLDVLAGRVKVHLKPALGQPQERIFCPVAVISAHQPSTIALAVDEDDIVRLDVIEGEVGVQHSFLPRNEPVMVKAIDAILIQKDQPISRRVDRGSLYRYTVKILTAITPGHSGTRSGEPVEQKFLASSLPGQPLVNRSLDQQHLRW